MNIENLLVTLSEENLKEIKYQTSILLALRNAKCATVLLGSHSTEGCSQLPPMSFSFF